MKKLYVALAVAAAASVGILAGCGTPEIAPSQKPLSKETLMLLGKKGLKADTPIFVRIFKEESELEVWKARDDGRYYHFKTYPICNWSGDLGPKLKHGDRQAPEGFYTVAKPQMNPSSQFHLAFNLGFPNAFDKAHHRTGDALMVHGKCRSAGCYAMTDGLIEEIYALAREAFSGGQDGFQVHAFPFRMTPANLARHSHHEWYPFWLTLKEGYDHFETTRLVPAVAVCARRYHVNVQLVGNFRGRIDPAGMCPQFVRPKLEPFVPKSTEQIAGAETIVPGPKIRSMAVADTYQAALEAERMTSRSGGLGLSLGGPKSPPLLSLGFRN